MIADISYPDLETRLAILKNKIKEKKINIPEDVLEYIATNISKNIREIEGALNRIIAYSQINNTIPNIETTTKILFQIINSPKKITNCKNIIKTVAEFYNITINDLIDRSRKKELVRPRQITMYLIRKELNNSYPSIGEKLGGRDHTTVMYACQKIEKDIQKQDSIIEELNLIKEKLYS